jgi:hypothetical protein
VEERRRADQQRAMQASVGDSGPRAIAEGVSVRRLSMRHGGSLN